MKKNVVVRNLLIACAVVLLGVLVALVILMTRQTGKSGYERMIEIAAQHVENGEYEKAITAYYSAIDMDETQDTAYLGLAEIYQETESLDELNYILTTGFEKTNSERIEQRLRLMNEWLITLPENAQVKRIAADLLEEFSVADYADYLTKYSADANWETVTGPEDAMSPDAKVRITFPDQMVNLFFREMPTDNAIPVEIHLHDLHWLFENMDDSLAFSDLNAMDLEGLDMVKVNSVGSAVTFRKMNCTVWVACNGEGTIESRYAWNCIVPDVSVAEQETRREEETQEGNRLLTGTVKDASTGKGVAGASVTLRDGAENEVFATETDGYGEYELEIKTPGQYTITVTADRYLEETFDADLNPEDLPEEKDLIISQQLATGQIRVVLTWGENPKDLDSHLVADDGNQVDYISMDMIRNGKTVATLDVDKTDSYGPETTTIYDTSMHFAFYVYRYSMYGSIGNSGAQIKIYQDGSDSPIILDAPSDAETVWKVFELKDGKIEIVNEAAQGGAWLR